MAKPPIRWPTRLMIALPLLGGCGAEREASLDLAATLLEQVATVGVADGPPEQVIGRIIDLEAAPDGSFFVLDAQAASVGWFDQQGAHRGGITARGEGPGELGRPTALALVEDRLAVMDPRNARLGFYRVGPGGVTFLEAFPGSFSGLDAVRNLCGVSGRWYVRSRRDGMMIHAIDSSGGIVGSFQPETPVSVDEFGPFAEIVRPQMSAGHIACLEEPPLVVSIEVFSSTVRAFSHDGDLVWEKQMRDIRPLRFRVSESGSLGLEDPAAEGSHLGRSIVRWSDRSVLVQYGIDRPEGFEGEPTYESIELSLTDGIELGRTDALPFIGDTSGDLVYAFQNEPFPQVTVFRRGR